MNWGGYSRCPSWHVAPPDWVCTIIVAENTGDDGHRYLVACYRD
jgi:hypothetical protein